MIAITRSLARRVRTVFSRGLGVSGRSGVVPVRFAAGAQGLSIEAKTADVAITYQHEGHFDSETLCFPIELLHRCAGSKDEVVTLEQQGQEVVAQWSDGGIPQLQRYPLLELKDFPTPADTTNENAPLLLTALREAVETVDQQSSRYALGNVQLCGSIGRIIATDGRQALVQGAFNFPWKQDLLVPASKIFHSAELATDEPVTIGKTADWVSLQAGPWTVHLRVQDGRYPEVEKHLPQPGDAISTLHFSDGDAEFLAKAVRRLPAGDEPTSPVTVDLNGQVVIRARADEMAAPTQLVLQDSHGAGAELRFNTNRDYLARAARLGFRDVFIFGNENPVHCRDEHRRYFWALLAGEGAIPASPDAVRIESVRQNGESTTKAPSTRRPTRPMTNTTNHDQNGHTRPKTKPKGEAKGMGLLDQAEGLRDNLHFAYAQAGNLVKELKQRKKQSRLVRTTLASLRELEAVEV